MRQKGDLSARITETTITRDQCIDIIYPQVDLKDQAVEARINQLITQEVYAQIPPGEECEMTVYGRYEINVNEKGVLSLNLQFFRMPPMAANGLNIQKSINVDLATGKNYQLVELFKSNSHYKLRLNEMIRQQIEEQGLSLIKEFNGISDYEDYYLTEDALVVYFQELEYTIHADGIPEFVIPYSKIDDITREDALIGKLLA